MDQKSWKMLVVIVMIILMNVVKQQELIFNCQANEMYIHIRNDVCNNITIIKSNVIQYKIICSVDNGMYILN